MRIRYGRPAIHRLAEIVSSIRELNPLAAVRFGQNLQRCLKRISVFPRSGFGVREFPNHPLLEFVVEPYRFFYLVDGMHQTVWIVGIWHSAQIPAEPELPVP
jgi:plasmid stabilization system protein ParE